MIKPEDKELLINQIETHVGERPLFYLKFCSKESYAIDVVNGNLYGNTPEFFRLLEQESGEQGQGDKFELLNIIETQNVIILDPDTKDVLFTAPSGQLKIEFATDKTIPIVSFVGISLRDMELFDFDYEHAEFRFPFTGEERKSIKDNFGDFCTIISARELEEKIKKYCNAVGAEYVFDKVIYCPQNTIQRIKSFNNGDKERFLYKNKAFEYQREYRLAIAIEIPNDHFIRLGKMDSAKVFATEEICNFGFSLKYKTVKNEEL